MSGVILQTRSNVAGAEGADNGQGNVRAYLAGNGLVNRGLYDLAAKEYRAFLSDQADHEKAPLARYGLSVCLFRAGKHQEAIDQLAHLQTVKDFEYAAEVGTILGQCRLALGDFAAAVDAFQIIVNRFENHDLADDAAGGRVEALYRAARYDDALEACKQFATRWPNSPLRERVDFFWASSLLGKREYGAAAERFSALLRRKPESSLGERSTLLLAQCYHQQGSLADAQDVYQSLVQHEVASAMPEALYGLAVLLQATGHPQQSGEYLDRFQKEYADHTLVASVRLYRGRAWFDEGKYDAARGVFERLAQDSREQRVEALYWHAKCRMREGAFAEAAEALRKLADEFPDDPLRPEFTYDGAVALFQSGDYAAAANVLTEYRNKFAEHIMAPDALQLLALSEHHLGQYDKSRVHCTEFLERHPSHSLAESVAFLAAENNFLAGQNEQAEASYRAFLKNYRGSSLAEKSTFRLGMALYRLEKDDEATALLRPIARGQATDEAYRPARLALGDIAFRAADWSQAEQQLETYLADKPDVPSADDALLKLGLARQRQEKHAAALKDFDRLLNVYADSPHRLQAIFERGQALLALNRPDDARDALERVLAEGDTRFRFHALTLLGTIAMKTGDFTEAAAQLAMAVDSSQDESLVARAMYQRGQALLASQKYADAEHVFRQFLDKHAAQPEVAQARAGLAVALARQNRYEDALTQIAECEQLPPGQLDNTLLAALQYERAWCLRELGQTEDAAHAYRRLLTDQSPAVNPHAVLELAAIESGAGRHDSATALLRELRGALADYQGDNAPALREQATYRLAVCRFESQDFKDAAALFAEQLDQFPKSELAASANYFCGEALFRLGRYEPAAVCLERVVADFPSDPACAAALLRLGECLAALQRWARSEQIFTQYLERFAHSDVWFQAQFGLGWARENQQRYDEAMAAYRKVIDEHDGPTAARAQFQIGECLFAQKHYDEAVSEFLKVDILYAYPEWSAAANYEAGQCFEKIGNTVEARRQFKQVTDKYAGSEWARLASERLEAGLSPAIPGK